MKKEKMFKIIKWSCVLVLLLIPLLIIEFVNQCSLRKEILTYLRYMSYVMIWFVIPGLVILSFFKKFKSICLEILVAVLIVCIVYVYMNAIIGYSSMFIAGC